MLAVHKFGVAEDGDISGYLTELATAVSPGFTPQGDVYVFVDECHRTQSGELHDAMKAILPSAMFIGFTGTPLLKTDKQTSLEKFGTYIHTYKFDKSMRDHGLFQAICRVNRLHGDDKEYGYIVDYKDLFKGLESSIKDYTSGAFDAYEPEDVAGLLTDRVADGRKRLEDALEAVRALCEPVEPPKDLAAHHRYFCGSANADDKDALKKTEPNRHLLYKLVASLLRAYANLASEMQEAGYSEAEAGAIKDEVKRFEDIRAAVKLKSGDYIDLKLYEPAMRHLIDTYIRADDSVKLSRFDDLSLVDMIVNNGVTAVEALPDSLKSDEEAVAETIENNVRKIITDEEPVDPEYYRTMSALLDALIKQRREGVLEYKAYLEKIAGLARQMKDRSGGQYPPLIDTRAKQALYNNLKDESLAIAIDAAVRRHEPDDFRGHAIKERVVRKAIADVLDDSAQLDEIFELVKAQSEY